MQRATGQNEMTAARFPWWPITLLAPLAETPRELRRMRYLWQTPIRLDGSKPRAFLGETPSIPIEQALLATLASVGSLPR